MKLLITALVLFFTQSALAYNPTQLQEFVTTGTCVGCDLSDTTVNSSVETPYNLSGSNISNSVIGLRNSTLSNFSGVLAVYANFENGDYSQANFENAILIKASLGGDFTYADFTGANLSGATFAGADLYGAKGINFSGVVSVCNAIMPDGSTGACPQVGSAIKNRIYSERT